MVKRGWTFFSNHGIVLTYIAKSPESTAQEIAQGTLLSIRGVQQIINDLEKAGYVRKHKNGRRNRYTIRLRSRLRHPLMHDYTIGEVLQSVGYKHKNVARFSATLKHKDKSNKR